MSRRLGAGIFNPAAQGVPWVIGIVAGRRESSRKGRASKAHPQEVRKNRTRPPHRRRIPWRRGGKIIMSSTIRLKKKAEQAPSQGVAGVIAVAIIIVVFAGGTISEKRSPSSALRNNTRDLRRTVTQEEHHHHSYISSLGGPSHVSLFPQIGGMPSIELDKMKIMFNIAMSHLLSAGPGLMLNAED